MRLLCKLEGGSLVIWGFGVGGIGWFRVVIRGGCDKILYCRGRDRVIKGSVWFFVMYVGVGREWG